MDKEDLVHIHNGILFSHKNNEIMPFAVHPEMVILYQLEKDKYHMISLLCVN